MTSSVTSVSSASSALSVTPSKSSAFFQSSKRHAFPIKLLTGIPNANDKIIEWQTKIFEDENGVTRSASPFQIFQECARLIFSVDECEKPFIKFIMAQMLISMIQCFYCVKMSKLYCSPDHLDQEKLDIAFQVMDLVLTDQDFVVMATSSSSSAST